MITEAKMEEINKALKRYPCRCSACGSRLVWMLLEILKPDNSHGVWLSPSGLTFGFPLEDLDPEKFVLLWGKKVKRG